MELTALDQIARDILKGNDRGGFTIPTAGLYPFQWNWDSIFAAWGFSTFDMPRAWSEIETLFDGQLPSGMVPHIVFRKDDESYFPGPGVWDCNLGAFPTSGISQPPVAATFIRKMYEADPELGRPIIERLTPKIEAWHRWFMAWRTSPEGAIFATHPWESGRDNAPCWDEAMASIDPGDVGPYKRRDTTHVDASMRPTKEDYDRYVFLVQRGRRLEWNDAAMAEDAPFRVAEPGLSFILLRANRDLAALCDVLGRDRSEIDGWTERLEGGAASLWNDRTGCYDSFDLGSGTWTNAITSVGFMCWYAGIDDARIDDKLADVMAKTQYPVPSLHPDDPRFDGPRYWRGPTWGMINTMIGMGLAETGRQEAAEALRARTQALLSTKGFAEYFDPLTGAPAGGGTFTWTAAIWLAWVRANASEEA